MAESRREKKLFVEVSATGRLKPGDPASARLSEVPGLWKLVPEIGRLMLLERVVDNRDHARIGRDREVVLAGVFDSGAQLAGVLDYVRMARLDGCMQIDSGEVKATLYLRRGVYLSGRTNLRGDRLGEVLVRAGMITSAQLDELVEDLSDGARLGNMMVTRGRLTTAQVYEGLRRQAEDIVYSVLRLDHGSYYMTAPLDMTAVPAMLRLDLKGLLMEGVRRLDEAGPSGTDHELRQRKPIPGDRLPADAAERIFDTYNEALRKLFGSVDSGASASLLGELIGFIENNEAYAELFSGVEVMTDGTLGIEVLENVHQLRGDRLATLQLGLNEMLFFLMFAAGDALDPKVEQVLQWRVAEVLEGLPGAG